ncbi:MAG TPA: type II toxin-antitoxin system CcdA family antitoxin [Rhodocyclaceae bacterium]|nr:type II toxin-antitoxin system CcdA family antitoxin [Rhodocyclaceae bacterium]
MSAVATVKKPTNLTLSADVLADAKSLGINISRCCDEHLRAVIKAEKERRWKEENAAAIDAYNKRVEEEGLPLDEWRSF